MTKQTDKQAQFEAFYLIEWPIKVNIIRHKDHGACLASQSLSEFEDAMPYAFKVATQMADVHAQSGKLLSKVGEKVSELVEYLELQAKKIDIMMSFILQQQDEPSARKNASKFGGGGLVVEHTDRVQLGETCEIKLFLESEQAAIYCYGEAIGIEELEDGKQLVNYLFSHIREADQELVVRASLHLQTKALRKRAIESK